MKTRTFFKVAAGAVFLLGFAFQALAQMAQVPVLSTNFVKPNVMIMLDTSGSMLWDINGKVVGQSGYLGTDRITIAKRVLTGEGMVSYQTQGMNVFMGKIGAASNVRTLYVPTPFTKIMLLNTSYKPDPTGTYFVFADNDDVMFTAAAGANTPSGMKNTATFTTLDQWLWKQQKYQLQWIIKTDITDGGTTSSYQLIKQRDVYQAVTSGAVSPRTVFVQHFADVTNLPGTTVTWTIVENSTPTYTVSASKFEAQPANVPVTVKRTSRIFPVAYTAGSTGSSCTGGCWTSGNGSNKVCNACYKPDLSCTASSCSTDYFVFMDTTDYNIPMNDTHQTFWIKSRPLSDYLTLKSGKMSYKQYDNTLTVCGDSSTGTCSGTSNDGRTQIRYVYQVVANGTSGATLFRNTDPTEAEVRTAMVGTIPQVQETDVINPDGIYGPDFIFKTTYNGRLEYAVRMGLGIPQPTLSNGSASNDILDYLNTALTYTGADGKTYHFLDGADTSSPADGTFDGLTYDVAYYEKNPGLLDVYTNIRWGLADFDGLGGVYNESCNGTDNDFPGCGARIDVSLPDEYTTATSAVTANANVQAAINAFSPNNATPLANAMQDMYRYFFAPQYKADLLKISGRNDTTPTMYVDQNCSSSDGNEGHVVQDEAAYLKGCRRNFLIFVTDGDQTSGLGCPSGDGGTSCPQASSITQETKFVNLLKQNGDYTKGVKVFLIGFALNGSANAIAELNAMALASKMDADDVYTTPFFANNQDALKAALTKIFNVIMEGSYTRSSPTTDAKEIAIITGYFTVKPNEPMWEGHLESYDTSTVSTPDELMTLMPLADGASVLNKTSPGNRDIFTAQPASGSTVWAYYKGSKVKWNKVDFITANAATLLADLNPGNQDGDTTGAGGASRPADVTDAKVVISFIRKDTDPPSPSDGKPAHFKPDPSVVGGSTAIGPPRTWTLGAINRSDPVLVGPPGGTASTKFLQYDHFQEKHKDRPVLIYVGANDGMLHAFFKDNLNQSRPPVAMEEAFAYIPNAVLSTLRYLRENQWYYVDSTPTVVEVFLPQPPWVNVNWGTTAPQAAGCDEVSDQKFCWRTLLVSGLGAGGRQYFALDVTDQDTISAANTSSSIPAPKIHPYWEFADKDWSKTPPTNRLGYTWSVPYLAELRLGDGDSTSVAAIFGGGWGASTETDVGNYIYFVNLDDASILKRYLVPDKDDPYWKTKVDAGSTVDPLTATTPPYYTSHNYLPGDPAVVDVPEKEGLSELLYIGDLQGRVWKVNMASGDHSKWKMCLFYDTGDRNGIGDSRSSAGQQNDNLPKKTDTTYAAFDALRRPVFYAPTVVEAPAGGRIVIFGTGHIEDTATARNQSVVNCMFAVWDQDPVDSDTVANLCNYGTLWNEEKTNTTDCPTCVSDIAYPFCFEPGEKLINQPSVSEGLLSFSTFKPYSDDHCDTANYNPCEPGMVRDWFVDYLTFSGIRQFTTEGSEGRYLLRTDASTGGSVLYGGGSIHANLGSGITYIKNPTGKTTDTLSWGEGISF